MAVSLRATCWSALLPRFRLRWLFAVTAAAAAWTGVITHRARDQQTAVRLIREQGGYVYYDFQERPPGSGRYDPKTQSSLPTWLLAKTGEDFFSDVVFVGLYSGSKRAGRGDLPYTSPQSVAPYLPALRKLRFLEFGDSELNDEALQFIGALKNLELLQSTREAPKVTDAGIAHLADLHKLKTLVLLNSSISDKSLEILAGLRSLKQLQLDGSRLSDRGLTYLRGMGRLQVLGLGRSRGITDRGMPSLAGLLRLEALDLSGASVTAAGLGHLERLQALRIVNLSNNRELTDDAMRILAQFNRLEELKLRNTKVTSKGMEHLGSLKKLRVLDLSDNSGVTDDRIAFLSQLASLEQLDLSNTKVSSLAVKYLGRLPKLSVLDLSENAAIDASAPPHLGKLLVLRELDLHKTRVMLSRRSAAQLKGLVALSYLDLAETGSDSRAVGAVLPRCQVAGARSAATIAARFGEATDYQSLTMALLLWTHHKQMIELDRMDPQGARKVKEFIPSPDLLPAQSTLGRMIALAKADGLDPVFAIQRPVLEAFSRAFRERPGRSDPPKEQARKLLILTRSNSSLERLYAAAIDFGLADALAEHVAYLESVSEGGALTDIEQNEYEEASEGLRDCLKDAGKQLEIIARPLADGAEDAIVRIWKDTADVALQTGGAESAKR